MKKLLINLLLSLLSPETISSLIAGGIAKLMEYARGDEEKWEIAKDVIDSINRWTGLFMEVYEDDKLTPEEEEKISNAIKNCTLAEKITELIKKRRGRKPRSTNQ